MPRRAVQQQLRQRRQLIHHRARARDPDREHFQRSLIRVITIRWLRHRNNNNNGAQISRHSTAPHSVLHQTTELAPVHKRGGGASSSSPLPARHH